jgi:hypothetical protein
MRQMITRLMRGAFLLALVFVVPLALPSVFAPYLSPASKYLGHVAVAQTARAGFDKGLLWRVEKPGAAPSYLFGTVHLADERVTTLPHAVKQQLDAAQSFTMEIALDPSNTAALAARMVYNDGRDLPMVAGADLFGEVVPLLVGKGVPQELARLFKPWAVMLMLVMPQQRPEDVLDVMLHRIASGQGKSLHYLETVDEQVAALEGMPESDQVALLMHAVATQHALPAMTGKLLEAYLQRDLGLIWRINEASVEDRPELKVLKEVFVRRLLLDRNTRMVERMQPQLRAGNAFVAVGALHLYGEQGILGLLQRDGYRVSQVY